MTRPRRWLQQQLCGIDSTMCTPRSKTYKSEAKAKSQPTRATRRNVAQNQGATRSNSKMLMASAHAQKFDKADEYQMRRPERSLSTINPPHASRRSTSTPMKNQRQAAEPRDVVDALMTRGAA